MGLVLKYRQYVIPVAVVLGYRWYGMCLVLKYSAVVLRYWQYGMTCFYRQYALAVVHRYR